MIKLPKDFLDRMKCMLKDEYINFYDAYKEKSYKGLRVNTLKCSISRLEELINFKIKPTSFSDLNFYILNEIESIGKHPLYHAGAFYMQEPSAGSVVTVLDPQKGDRILDLCAAPGGKSTQIAAKLDSEGLLWSNEIVRNRANILLSNIERLGVKNAVVSSSHPDILCSKLNGYFDKVLVDAPCSCEGMFRKDQNSIKEWSYDHVLTCAKRQISILNSAAKALKPNGILVYSTCTFSKEENENVIEKFLSLNKNFELVKIENSFGRDAYGLDKARRIFPMDGGEGHFVAKLKKICEDNSMVSVKDKIIKKESKEAYNLYEKIFSDEPYSKLIEMHNNIIMIPRFMPDVSGVNIIRAGVKFGEVRRSRIEPYHSIFMASRPENIKNVIDFKQNSVEIQKFLKGEEINIKNNFKGYVGISVESIMLGFGKCSNFILKNKYPKGLRNK